MKLFKNSKKNSLLIFSLSIMILSFVFPTWEVKSEEFIPPECYVCGYVGCAQVVGDFQQGADECSDITINIPGSGAITFCELGGGFCEAPY